MRAYVISTSETLEPFNDHPRDCLVGNKPLSQVRDKALHALGLKPVMVDSHAQIDDSEPYIVLEDRLFFTPELLATFLAASRSRGTSTLCGIRSGMMTDTTAATTQGLAMKEGTYAYPLCYEPVLPARGEPGIVAIETGFDFEPLPVPKHMSPTRDPRLPVTALLIVRIDHWVNLWAANLSMLIADLARLKKGKLRLMGLALKARSLNKWKVLRKTNVIGRGCDIHPTAYVEGSHIGDGTQIGAGAVVRSSLVGAGSRIINRATVEFSVLGEHAYVMNGCTSQFSVLYPGHLAMSNLVSLSICGRDTFIGDGATLADFRFDGRTVRVLKHGTPLDTGITFLGGCLGHGAYLGAGCILAPGRMLPNGLRITRDSGVIHALTPGAAIEGFRVVSPLRQL